jgi:hypothetical protein
MKKYIIFWNCGYGSNYEIVEVADEEAASGYAYEAAKEDFESNVDYKCIGEATKELCEEYGV